MPIRTRLTFAFAPLFCALVGMAQMQDGSASATLRVSGYKVRIQVLSNGDLKTTEKITLSSLPAHGVIERTVPLLRRDQTGNQWQVRYADFLAFMDGQPIELSRRAEENRLTMSVSGGERGFAEGEHNFIIEYVASNAFRRRGDVDSFEMSVGGEWQIDRLELFIIPPPNLPEQDVYLNAYTDVTATTLNCDCMIERNQDHLSIVPRRVLQSGERLSFSLALKAGYLRRGFSGKFQDFELNNHAVVSWAIFTGSLAVYCALMLAIMRFVKKKAAFVLERHSRLFFLLGSIMMSAVSLTMTALVRKPEVAMPGVLGGMLISMMIGGTEHGPSQRYLWIVFALFMNALLYYGIFLALNAVLGRRRTSERRT